MTAATAEEQFGEKSRWISTSLTAVVAATRFLAVSRSMWSGDEASCAVSNAVSAQKRHIGDDARDVGMQLRTTWWQP